MDELESPPDGEAGAPLAARTRGDKQKPGAVVRAGLWAFISSGTGVGKRADYSAGVAAFSAVSTGLKTSLARAV